MNIDIQPLRIPDSLPLERRPNPKDDVTGDALNYFDKKTVLYDVFLDPVEKDLIAYGPPLLNLEPYLSRLVLKVNGKEVAYDWEDHPELKVSVLKAKLSSESVYDISFVFPDFEGSVRIHDEPVKTGRKVLAAISKNNRVSWVADWVDYYKSNYDIDDVVVYDNGSENRAELKKALADKAYVIDWDFPYGPAGKNHNKFAQPGALNHCLKRFAREGVLFNFDIDELLVCDKADLGKAIHGSRVLYFDSYIVPYIKPAHEDYSFKDFVHRRKSIKKTARKFVCKEEGVSIISQHNTWDWFRLPFYAKLRRNKPERHLFECAYFLHFMGITNKTQPELKRFEEASVEELEFDSSHLGCWEKV